MFARIVRKQGEKIIKLEKAKKELKNKNEQLEWKNFNTNREYLSLMGILDNAQEEFLNILNNIEEILASNNYGQAEIKIRKALEEIRKQKDITIKDLEINNESSTTFDGNR